MTSFFDRIKLLAHQIEVFQFYSQSKAMPVVVLGRYDFDHAKGSAEVAFIGQLLRAKATVPPGMPAGATDWFTLADVTFCCCEAKPNDGWGTGKPGPD